jgi:hypothetical protein
VTVLAAAWCAVAGAAPVAGRSVGFEAVLAAGRAAGPAGASRVPAPPPTVARNPAATSSLIVLRFVLTSAPSFRNCAIASATLMFSSFAI